MPRGGKRAGSGRKTGALTRKTREIATQASSKGVTPLEVMLANMRFAHEEANALLAKISNGDAVGADEFKQLLGLREAAEDCARDAAPYVHPRLASIQHAGEGGGPLQTSVKVTFVSPKRKGD